MEMMKWTDARGKQECEFSPGMAVQLMDQGIKYEIFEVPATEIAQDRITVSEQRAVAREMADERGFSGICPECGAEYQDYCERCDG